jgi:hypothetical protein
LLLLTTLIFREHIFSDVEVEAEFIATTPNMKTKMAVKTNTFNQLPFYEIIHLKLVQRSTFPEFKSFNFQKNL